MCWIEGQAMCLRNKMQLFLHCSCMHSTPSEIITLCSSPSAIIEHVRDGSVVRALLLPDYYLVTVMLSGVKVEMTHYCFPV